MLRVKSNKTGIKSKTNKSGGFVMRKKIPERKEARAKKEKVKKKQKTKTTENKDKKKKQKKI